jgi:AraC-like DNA-binding protein
VIFKVATAFILLIIIPFGIGIVVLNIAYEGNIRQQWHDESEARLVAIQDDINDIHLELNSMLAQIRQDEALSPHLIHSNSYHMRRAMMQLRRYQGTGKFIHVLAYIEQDHGTLISNLSSDEQKHFTNRIFGITDTGHDEFWSRVNNSNDDAFFEPLMVLPSSATRGSLLTYAANLRGTRIFNTPQIVVILDASAIEAQFAESLLREASSLVITNHENRILLSAGALSDEFSALQYSSFTLHQGEYPFDLQDYVVTHSTAANGWNYYMFLPEADLLQDVRGATLLYSLFGLAFAGASILFFILYYRFNILPLKRVASLVSQEGSNKKLLPPKGSEYGMIYDGYQALVKDKNSMQRQLDESYPIRCSYLLHQLLIGGVSEKEGLEQSKALDLDLEQKRFYSVVLLFAADSESIAENQEIQDFVRTYLSENNLGFFVSGVLDDALTVLLALPFPEQEAHKLEVVRLQAGLSEAFKIYTMACISGNHSRPGDIRLSFQEAVRASRYRSISGKNSCITFSETGEDSAFSRSYPTKLLQSFYHALSHENPEAILERMREIRRLMEGFTITLYRCIYCDMAFGLFHYFRSKSPIPPLSGEILDDITRALETEEMREMQNLMGYLENKFIDMSGEEANLEKLIINFVDRVRKYVDDHYIDPGLSIMEIAEAMGVSTGHLSRSYKKDTGETLLNYINTKRIEKAKSLLADTDIPLHEVVQEIGYLDVSSFHRKFKSTVGCTPGMYRENARDG